MYPAYTIKHVPDGSGKHWRLFKGVPRSPDVRRLADDKPWLDLGLGSYVSKEAAIEAMHYFIIGEELQFDVSGEPLKEKY